MKYVVSEGDSIDLGKRKDSVPYLNLIIED
jgi:hypothetical protein